MLGLPRSARLAAWADCWLAGQVTLDEVIVRVQGDDEPHTVTGLPTGPETLSAVLGSLRAGGTRALQVALPRPGDPQGLAGPPELTIEAIAAGEAVLCVGAPVALVPAIRSFGSPGDYGHLVNWAWWNAVPPPPGPGFQDAERTLSEKLLAAATTLADLDFAAWRPEITRVLEDIRSNAAAQPLPRTFPPAAQALAARAVRVLTVVAVALDDDGRALTAAAAQARHEALGALERAARHALVAACNVRAQ